MDTAHFDRAAATWDDNPVRLQLTRAIATAVAAQVPPQAQGVALEYGCGTATLSFLLAGHVGRVVAADTSPGMLAQVRRKLAAAGVSNVIPRQLDLTRGQVPRERYDLILCAMALHHVADAHRLLRTFAALLRPGGWLALADLEREDGSFHGAEHVPHYGFEPATLTATLAAAGLTDAAWRTVHQVMRNGRTYPVFLLTARRPDATSHEAAPATTAP